MTHRAENTGSSNHGTQPGWDSMIEDIFGLNIRGARTLWDVFVKPKPVFVAARNANWQDRRYTPSIRLFLSLVTFTLLLRFFWAGPESNLAKFAELQLEAQLAANIEGPARAFSEAINTEAYIESILLGMPVALMLAMIPAALLLRIWGPGTRIVSRLRLYFLAATPGYVVSFLVTFGLELLPFTIYTSLTMLSFIMILVTDAITAWRAPVHAKTTRTRAFKAGLFAGINTSAYLIASIIMGVYASTVAVLPAI